MKISKKIKLTFVSVVLILASGVTISVNADQINGLEITGSTAQLQADGTYKEAFITSDGDEWILENDGFFRSVSTGAQGVHSPDKKSTQQIDPGINFSTPNLTIPLREPDRVEQLTPPMPDPIESSKEPDRVEQLTPPIPTPIESLKEPARVEQLTPPIPTPIESSKEPGQVEQLTPPIPTPIESSKKPGRVEQLTPSMPNPIESSKEPDRVEQLTPPMPDPIESSKELSPVEPVIPSIPDSGKPSSVPNTLEQVILPVSNSINEFSDDIVASEIKAVALYELPVTGSDDAIRLSFIGALTFGISVLMVRRKMKS